MPRHRSSIAKQPGQHAKGSPPAVRGPPAGIDQFAVVGIGASAGGLEVCRKLLDVLPADTGMAFILVQHLDPTHESMMVDLLAAHTAMTVLQAANGMPIEPGHLYLIPPGSYLSVKDAILQLSARDVRHGARMPFDFLLRSLADDYRSRAVCVVLSGSGADGSLGLRAIRENGGWVIAQDPAEAGFDGMPRSAIATGEVDQILTVAAIPKALLDRDQARLSNGAPTTVTSLREPPDGFAQIIELLRTKTAHNFTLYKPGTLKRRIERRMGLLSIEATDTARYHDLLTNDDAELGLLAKDLLINVTNFFRDPKVFAFLADHTLPDLIKAHPADQPIRIWIAGCSTGEEAYSVAMLFREAITVAKRNIQLQVFASDVDPDAVAVAREGVYPETIVSDVSADRLARFFSKEEHCFRVSPELRAIVVFTVQDVLADPPFSRLDLISCRNLLIYLGSEAQKKVLASFHFALREGGILLLGSAETVGSADDRFKVISKPERLYRHVGRTRPGELGLVMAKPEPVKTSAAPGPPSAYGRQTALAEFCRRTVLDTFAPAAIFINVKNECVYSLGPTERYMHMASGHPTHDILAMAPRGLRTKLRSAIQQASATNTRVAVAGSRRDADGKTQHYEIDVQTMIWDGEVLRVVCFLEVPSTVAKFNRSPHTPDAPQASDLELELEATRTELQGAIHNLEISSEEQKAVNEEALSVNEEFQSTNEELLTSKEELQSLNEELTVLNSQLQETLEQQRTTSNDLQNVLYSTDIATLFLDPELNIRFFTPATKSIFKVISSDIGRPLADLASLAEDSTLAADAHSVLATLLPIEKELETRAGVWFTRRILPYRTHDSSVEGVVITFTDITERKRIRKALELAKQEAERANLAKSRFLAAASHDLRQPLQTLVLLQGLLDKSVDGARPQQLLGRLEETVDAMSGMLNTLLDINQIEAGIVRPQTVDFEINELLVRLKEEFGYHAAAKGLGLRMVPCSLTVHSDARLLEQISRNLLSNALKYTKTGRILIGCRRLTGCLRIEIWDTGIGIPDAELAAIFEEYHQLDNDARERVRGMGLGLSIVQRLAGLLETSVRVRSRAGKGSVFAIEVPLKTVTAGPNGHNGATLPDQPLADVVAPNNRPPAAQSQVVTNKTILIVEDDPDLRDLLAQLFTAEGYETVAAENGPDALARVSQMASRPSLILADFNLPLGMNGLQVATLLRADAGTNIPAVMLTGDITAETMAQIADQDVVQLVKPIKLDMLAATVSRLLSSSQAAGPISLPVRQTNTADGSPAIVYVVDDDRRVRLAIRSVLEDHGLQVEDFAACEPFLEAYRPAGTACLLVDAYLPGMDGLELLNRLAAAGYGMPAIMITGNSDVAIAVQAMKAGAFDFIEKPIGARDLLACIGRALDYARDTVEAVTWREKAISLIADLTAREREIMEFVLAGHANKNIAVDLGISQRTVENHRASIMTKTHSKSLPDLVRLAMATVSGAIPGPAAAGDRGEVTRLRIASQGQKADRG
jgi:two-component system, chemotaxis family, CheB/CheR fusion protein